MIKSVIKSHLSVPFFRTSYQSQQGYIGAAIRLNPSHAHMSFPLPDPSGVLLCCQITKWLFACYKQRKQILYRYYIYIDMFFHWEMRIGIHIPLIHILKDNTQIKNPHSSTHSYIYAIANSNLWKNLKESHFLSC